jgi:hypothetical protein
MPQASLDGGTPDAGPLGVTGRSMIFRVSLNGEQPEPVNLSTTAVTIYVGEADGGWSTHPGGGDATGGFAVPDVPLGRSFWLRVGDNYIYTSARDLDLSSRRYGRTNRVFPTLPSTGVDLQLTQLTPWEAGDGFQLASLGAGVRMFTRPFTADAGIDALAVTVPFGVSKDALIDGSLGDRVEISQFVAASSGGNMYGALRRSFRPAPFTMNDGATTPVSGVTVSLPVLNATIDWRRSEYEQFAAISVPPPGSPGAFSRFWLNALERGQALGTYDTGPQLVDYYELTQTTDLLMTFTFGNPFDGTDIVTDSQIYFRTSYALPNATVFNEFSYIRDFDSLTASISAPIHPRLSPPLNPRLNGMSLFAPLAGVGISPTVSWDPPAVGNPTLYSVTVYELGVQNGATTSTTRATLITADVKAVLPPVLLRPGAVFYLRIAAQNDASRSITRPFWSSNPHSLANLLTSTFTP